MTRRGAWVSAPSSPAPTGTEGSAPRVLVASSRCCVVAVALICASRYGQLVTKPDFNSPKAVPKIPKVCGGTAAHRPPCAWGEAEHCLLLGCGERGFDNYCMWLFESSMVDRDKASRCLAQESAGRHNADFTSPRQPPFLDRPATEGWTAYNDVQCYWPDGALSQSHDWVDHANVTVAACQASCWGATVYP